MAKKYPFVVDTKGLRTLQEGKPKVFILRELIANAFDEDIKECIVNLDMGFREIKGVVIDDSPEGFKDLRDAYTIFRDTYKRADPTKRGRFNIGEKQALCRCKNARIDTMKGSVIFDFDKGERYSGRNRTKKGTKVEFVFRASQKDFEEILSELKTYLSPKDIKFLLNGELIPYRKPFKIISATLTTEINNEEGILSKTKRKTDIHIHKVEDKPHLYEMGIPVEEIECKYSIDVQQKIPLGIDRETVSEAYLKDVYAEVLNATINDIEEEEISSSWVKISQEDDRTKPKILKKVLDKRYGKKHVVASPNDPISVDEAKSRGYTIIHGRQESKETWQRIKESKTEEPEIMPSSTEKFGSKGFAVSTPITPNPKMSEVAVLINKIAQRFQNTKWITVEFVKSPNWSALAQYSSDGKKFTFNVTKLGMKFFDEPISAKMLNLIIHELAHEQGHHTDKSYHEEITRLAGELIITALKEPEFFN